MTIQDRATGWLDHRFHEAFRESFAFAGGERRIGCLAYCLMPDHAHLLLCGLEEDSDQKLFVRSLRRTSGESLNPFRWQKQPYDNVLREHDRSRGALLSVAHYIVLNPLRAGLTKEAAEWPFRGAWLPTVGWLDPCAPDFGAAFWTAYNRLVDAR